MAETQGTDVQLRVDDHVFLARAADGTPVAFVKGNLKRHEDGSIVLDLGRYRPLQPPGSRPP